MSIKRYHTHEDGKECFKSDGGYTEVGLYEINGVEYLMGYKMYTAQWYCYDPLTGWEIANFSKGFYTNCIQQHRISNLVRDPTCV